MITHSPRSFSTASTAAKFFSKFYDWSFTGCGISSKERCITQTIVRRNSFNHFHVSARHQQLGDAPPSTGDEPPLSSKLRELMRGIPHSVVVATASTGVDDTPGSFKGMTISSFTTLTLTPTPIITFNIRKPSQTLNAIRGSREFLIHVLLATESGAAVADCFTKGNDKNVFRSSAFQVLRMSKHAIPQPPLLASSGISRVLRCRLRDEPEKGLLEIGEHVLVLANVVSIIEPPVAIEDQAESRGLCYLDREYRYVGNAIKIAEKASVT